MVASHSILNADNCPMDGAPFTDLLMEMGSLPLAGVSLFKVVSPITVVADGAPPLA